MSKKKVMTRRSLLTKGAALAAASVVSTFYGCGDTSNSVVPDLGAGSVQPPVPPPFLQPQVLKSTSGTLDTSLVCQIASNTVGGKVISTRTYQGVIGGPTLRVKPGETLRLNIINNFPPNPDENTVYADMNIPHHFNTTNNHVHGLHVSPTGNSDNIFVEIKPGSSFQYEYKIPADHPPGTYFYHPHKHGSVSMQMFGGMAAALIIEGGLDNVPEVAAARDLVYLINELNIDPVTGQVPPYTIGGAFPLPNRILTVNGQVTPTLKVFSGEVVRLRVINATVRTNIPFSIDGHDLNLAAMDGVTFASLRNTNSGVFLAPANRGDILLKGKAPGIYAIKKLVDPSNQNPDPESIIGFLEVLPTTVNMSLPTNLPVPAALPDIKAAEVTKKRTVIFNVTPNGPAATFSNFTVDGKRFDPAVIDWSPTLDSVEEWTLQNDSNVGHPFHIHVNPFQVIAINGVPLPVPEWRDTVLIPKKSLNTSGTVTIRQRYKDFKGLFVFHCHILVHEDIGMMQTVNVI